MAHKCGPKELDHRDEMKNDNNEFWLGEREYHLVRIEDALVWVQCDTIVA